MPEFKLWGFDAPFYLQNPTGGELFLLALYAVFFLLMLIRSRKDFIKLGARGWMAFIVLIAASFAFGRMLLVQFPPDGRWVPVGIPAEPSGPALALLGGIPVMLAAAALGPGPALIVGLAGGLARAGWDGGAVLPARIVQIGEWGAVGVLAGEMLVQRWRSAGLLRHPIIAGVWAGLIVWPLMVLDGLARGPWAGIANLEYALRWGLPHLPILLLELGIGGAAALIVGLRPAPAELLPPPWGRKISHRIAAFLVPLSLIAAVGLFGVVAVAAYDTATANVLDRMAHDAHITAGSLPFFFETGSTLIRDLAGELAESRPDRWRDVLAERFRVVPYFHHLIAERGEVRMDYPPDFDVPLTPEELMLVALALEEGMPSDGVILQTENGPAAAFIAPIEGAGGVLIGRTLLAQNRIMKPVIANLQDSVGGSGLIVDADGEVVVWPGAEDALPFAISPAASMRRVVLRGDSGGGAAYMEMGADGAQQFVYVLPVEGLGWSVVIRVPGRIALEQAAQIASPILVGMAVLGAVGFLGIAAILNRVTGAVSELAAAADDIAGGHLQEPMPVQGEDEIGRLGASFESMRQVLNSRMSDQERLLELAQAIAASLDLDRTLPRVADTARAATGASGARLIVLSSPPAAYDSGARSLGALDLQLLDLLRDKDSIRVNVDHADALLDVGDLRGQIATVTAWPLRAEGKRVGMLSMAYDAAHIADESEEAFLAALTNQTATGIARAQLYQTVRRGREQFAAVLAATPDAIMVADRAGRMMLMNPAAEEILGMTFDPDAPNQIEDVLADAPHLAELIRSDPETPGIEEWEHPDGRTFYPRVSDMRNESGGRAGRVLIMRDITRRKQLDAMKDQFVSTVSHDLRSPLTYMRGFASMLEMVGEMNEKQRYFKGKILAGIDQMTDLIEKILNADRWDPETGFYEMEREPLILKDLIDDIVFTHREKNDSKKLTLRQDIDPNIPVLKLDAVMMRQAIGNLVDNAIKYTPENGAVTVGAHIINGDLRVSVRDNGRGISHEDQEELFDRFVRIRNKETAKIKGIGLGLFIVRSVARRHGGEAWVESEPGEGSTFFISLPLDGANVLGGTE